MTELPAGDDHQVIRIGDSAAVVVPLDEYGRLRELEQGAELVQRADAEEESALAEYRANQLAGTATSASQDEVRKRFGLSR